MLTTEQILTYLQLDGIGNSKVFELCKHAIKNRIELEDPSDMADYIRMCIDKKIVTRYSVKRYGEIDIDSLKEASSKARNIISRSWEAGIGIVSYYDNDFPEQLENIVDEEGKPANPLVIYYKGNLSAIPRYGIALIGTREPTPEGIRAGEYFGEKFAEKGLNIISGLALGCDASGHRGALKANGFTTAFLAHGLDTVYPSENEKLANEIVEKGGLLISEYPIGTPPMANFFVTRDRLQSGMADATLVIQTGTTGGTMHAVTSTIKAQKLLYAVTYRGDVNQADKVQGNAMLINSRKAIPLTSGDIDAVLEQIKRPSDLFSAKP